MDDWLDRFAEGLGVERVTPEEMGALLRLAREVAHGTDDRRLAPLSTFLAGVRAGGQAGASRGDAVAAALEAARELLPGSGEDLRHGIEV